MANNTMEQAGDGLKTRMVTISSLRQNFAPKDIPSSLNVFPCSVILPGPVEYHITHGGAQFQDVNFRILVLLGRQDQPDSLNKILDYIDPTGSSSVVAAIEGDKTLGGVADDTIVQNNTGVGSTLWGNQTYLSTEFEVLVLLQ